jgi:hypothetical protein
MRGERVYAPLTVCLMTRVLGIRVRDGDIKLGVSQAFYPSDRDSTSRSMVAMSRVLLKGSKSGQVGAKRWLK